MFYEIPKNTDLTNTSYRCYKETEEAVYIEYNEGFIGEDWEKISEKQAKKIAPEWFEEHEPVHQPTQMDRIETMLNTLTTDTVTTESVNTAISEGVNEV